ncbi:MAG: MFS transporter [Brachybacterium sp.]
MQSAPSRPAGHGSSHPRADERTETLLKSGEGRRVVMATAIGTAVEWYDYFLYASAAGLVFGQVFFSGMGRWSVLLAFATVGVSFLFRPLGAFLAGHFGDRYGRKVVLMVTLVMMGGATAAIGLLPTTGQIGILAPILLILLRILQGVSAGGEWGGAALMAVEHAPLRKRGLFGSAPQVGVPLGLILASAVLALMGLIAPGDAFVEWGWRIPFLLSVVLIFIGYYIRRNLEESPVFQEIKENQKQDYAKSPITDLFRHHWVLVLLIAVVAAGNSGVGYMMAGGYIQSYASNPSGPIGLPASHVFGVVTAAGATWLAFTIVGGWLSDRIGRRTTYLVGWALQLLGVLTLFPLVNLGTAMSLFAGLGFLTIGLGLTYGPSPSYFAEVFPASIRFSGLSISYALGSIIGGAFAPTIAEFMVETTGSTGGVTIYLSVVTLVACGATLVLRDRSRIPLGPEHEDAQSVSPVRGLRRV